MNQRVHIILAGPLRATARATGPFAGRPFDATTNVLEIAREWGRITEGSVVVSTWDDAAVDDVRRINAVAEIVRSADPGRPPLWTGPAPDNRLRAATSVAAGLERLDASPADVVVVGRADQRMDLDRLVAHLGTAAPLLTQGRLGVTGVHRTIPYYIRDIMFYGTVRTVTGFFDAQLGPFGRAYLGGRSVHDHLIRAWQAATEGVAPPLLFEPSLASHTAEQRRLDEEAASFWHELVTRRLTVLPRPIAATTIWRGESHEERIGARFAVDDAELATGWLPAFQGSATAILRWISYADEVPAELAAGGPSRRTRARRTARRALQLLVDGRAGERLMSRANVSIGPARR